MFKKGIKSVSLLLVIVMICSAFNIIQINASALDYESKYVSTAKSVHYYYTSNEGSKVDVTYKIPKILLNSNDAKTVNSEILSTYESAFEMAEEIKGFKSNQLSYTELDYDYYVNDSVLSVITHFKYPNNNYTEYSVYNFDIITGKLLTNEDITENMSMNYEKVKEQIADKIESKFNEVKEFVEPEFYNQQYQKSISDDNLKFSRLYIAENNQLMAMYRVYWVAGAECYYYLMEIDSSIGNIIFGDANGDGEVNAKDRMMLTRYLAKWTGYESIDKTAADVNNDGDVNAKDRMILTRHLAKWQGYENLPLSK